MKPWRCLIIAITVLTSKEAKKKLFKAKTACLLSSIKPFSMCSYLEVNEGLYEALSDWIVLGKQLRVPRNVYNPICTSIRT